MNEFVTNPIYDRLSPLVSPHRSCTSPTPSYSIELLVEAELEDSSPSRPCSWTWNEANGTPYRPSCWWYIATTTTTTTTTKTVTLGNHNDPIRLFSCIRFRNPKRCVANFPHETINFSYGGNNDKGYVTTMDVPSNKRQLSILAWEGGFMENMELEVSSQKVIYRYCCSLTEVIDVLRGKSCFTKIAFGLWV